MILDQILLDTKKRVKKLYQRHPLESWKSKADKVPLSNFKFHRTIENNSFSIIAEIKKASPSKGMIDKAFDYKQIAKDYKEAGVNCISVLTEPYHFSGRNEYIQTVKQISELPVLRKDFIIDEIQIYESVLLGADCILLICKALSLKQLTKFLQIAETLQLSALVEAHTLEDVTMALQANAKMIGVNNRDLQTFEVDLQTSLTLRESVPSDVMFVSESGIKTVNDIKRIKTGNINAVLIGETLMRSKDKKMLIKEFINA